MSAHTNRSNFSRVFLIKSYLVFEYHSVLILMRFGLGFFFFL